MVTAYKSVLAPPVGVAGVPAEKGQKKNLAGGYAWVKDDLTRLRDFLILGSESGTYYADEKSLTAQNAAIVKKLVSGPDARKALDIIVEIGKSGRAPKHSPALLALAIAIREGKGIKRQAARSTKFVCRTGAHLLELFSYLDAEKSEGQTYKLAAQSWYSRADSDPQWFAYQAAKYRERSAWTHQRILDLSHYKFSDPDANAVASWAVGKWEPVGPEPHDNEVLRQIWAMESIKNEVDVPKIASYVEEYRLTREMVPTSAMKDPMVLHALAREMPLGASIRMLGPMTANGLFEKYPEDIGAIVKKLGNADALKHAKIHPVNILLAAKVYAYGKGLKGNLTWAPDSKVIAALNEAFYLAYGSIEQTGKRYLFAVDCSGSMERTHCAGSPLLSAHEASGAMVLPMLNAELNADVMIFTDRPTGHVDVRGRRLDDAVRAFNKREGRGTDLAVPITYALEKKREYDAVVIFTDSETWAGTRTTKDVLKEYRNKINAGVKMVICSVSATATTVCDPDDAMQLGIAGFDANVPSLIQGFLGNETSNTEEE